MNAKSLLTSLLLSVGVVAVYHLQVSGPADDARTARLESRVADLTARLGALEEVPPGAPSLAGRGEDPDGPTFEERLAALEEKARRALEAPMPPAAGPVSPLIEAAEAKARQQVRERELAMRRVEILRLDPQLAENDVSEAARLLSNFAQAVRDLYEGKDFAGEDERALLRQRFDELQGRLEADLGRCVGPELARRLAGAGASADSEDR